MLILALPPGYLLRSVDDASPTLVRCKEVGQSRMAAYWIFSDGRFARSCPGFLEDGALCLTNTLFLFGGLLMWACESWLFPFRRSISVTDPQDNFAAGATRLTELVRAARFAERKDAIDYRREFARVDDLRDLSELSTARVASHKCGADAEFFGFLFRWRLD